jgi:Mn2+/Fe2+ NRAMP family transporter
LTNKFRKILTIIGPGLLVAATGIGAGDLATAAFSGSKLGLSVLWAVVLGAFFKFVLNEGLARWQLATGYTLLEGAMSRLGRVVQYFFMLYLLVWSFMVAAALMSACGVTAHAILPLLSDPASGKIFYGIIISLAGVYLVRKGGYRFFEKVMTVSIGFMFVAVIITAILMKPDLPALISGLFLPSIPMTDSGGLEWTVALIGGVGGTVTVLCYGYWIREEKRSGAEQISNSRLDLFLAYLMTALFGIGMIIIGSTIVVEGKGAALIIQLAEKLVDHLGTVGKWIFLLGSFGAVFSSLLGVWQSVPYLFTDLVGIMGSKEIIKDRAIDTNSRPYRWYLYGMAIIPIIGLWIGFARMQKLYAITGALFIPMLTLVLLWLNSREKWIGAGYNNKPLTSFILIIIILFFMLIAGMTFRNILGI